MDGTAIYPRIKLTGYTGGLGHVVMGVVLGWILGVGTCVVIV